MECEACRLVREEGISHKEAINRLQIRDAHFIEQYGWVAHGIVDDVIPSLHTHGLPENYGHMDLEIQLPAKIERLKEIMDEVVRHIQEGTAFHDGEENINVFTVPIRFVEKTEDGRKVLRVILPDPNGYFPGNPNCASGYDTQLLDVNGFS